MDIGIISVRYAKALFEYASESGAEDRVYEEMRILARTFHEVPGLRSALDNPILEIEEKLSLVGKAAGGNVSKEFSRFMELIFQHHREKYLQFMMLSYIDLYRRKKNITVGKLITAFPVDETTEARMKKMVRMVTHGSVEFESKVDPEIEGGFIYEVGTYRIDGSIVNQFKKIKKQFIEKNRRIV